MEPLPIYVRARHGRQERGKKGGRVHERKEGYVGRKEAEHGIYKGKKQRRKKKRDGIEEKEGDEEYRGRETGAKKTRKPDMTIGR